MDRFLVDRDDQMTIFRRNGRWIVVFKVANVKQDQDSVTRVDSLCTPIMQVHSLEEGIVPIEKRSRIQLYP